MKLEPPKPTVTSVRFETGDALQISRLSLVAAGPHYLFGTFLRDDGQIIALQETLPALVASNITRNAFLQTGGYLLNLSVVPQDTENDTATYCQVNRLRGAVDTIPNRLVITGGYLAEPTGLSYPQQPAVPLAGDPSEIITAIGAGPGPGSDLFITTEFASAYSVPYSANITFTASVAVANRRPSIRISNTTGLLYVIPGRTDITAGQTRNLFLWNGPNLPTDSALGLFYPMPDQVKGVDMIIETNTSGLDAGDEYTQYVVTYAARPTETIF